MLFDSIGKLRVESNFYLQPFIIFGGIVVDSNATYNGDIICGQGIACYRNLLYTDG